MAEINLSQSNPQVQLLASPFPRLNTPPWLTEALLIAQLWHSTGLLQQLQDSVQVPRGRAGTYEVCDFTLLLLAYATSHEPSFNDFRVRLSPYIAPLAFLWQRAGLPSASALSRFLADIDATPVAALDRLLFQDLLQHGISGSAIGGLLDRQGQRQLLFDVDATVEAVRQRSLVCSKDRPPPQRRRSRACAPGYRGRKRGELVHSRVVVQQAHTREWLGSFGAPGNPDLWGSLRCAASHILQYLQSHGLAPSCGLVRQDGAYGYAQGACILAREFGLGYLMRCADYRLLDHASVVACLRKDQPEVFAQLDTGTVPEIYDVGLVEWHAGGDAAVGVPTRLVVTATPAPEQGKPRVGKLRDGKVYELFVTDRAPEGLLATDLLSLYFGRGGFEGSLAEEDREADPDHWLSNHPDGQAFWQLLAQQVWNLRLRLGFSQELAALRCTLWAEAQRPQGEGVPPGTAPLSPQQAPARQASPEEAPAPGGAAPPRARSKEPAQVAGPAPQPVGPAARDERSLGADTPREPAAPSWRPAAAYGKGKFSGQDVRWQAEGKLSCPAGKELRLVERHGQGESYRLIYEAEAEDCRGCSLAANCLRTAAQGYHGRRVSFVQQVEAAVHQEVGFPSQAPLMSAARPPVGLGPVLWEDWPARALRRGVSNPLSQQRVVIVEVPSSGQGIPGHKLLLSRDQRAHRRLSWQQRLARNALPSQGTQWRIQLFGVPRGIAEKLGITLRGEMPA
jgi:hypothetical protein